MIHIFDLDKTLWDTQDRHGNSIWAKQMIFPFVKINEDKILDDVYSYCTLRKGVRSFIKKLYDAKHQIGFISNARHHDFSDEYQPSLELLKMFGIWEYFNNIKILQYKTKSKAVHLNQFQTPVIFYDDDVKIRSEVSHLQNITVIDSSNIFNWDSYND
jgi:predicted phosphatase